jgi:hypothetical protein
LVYSACSTAHCPLQSGAHPLRPKSSFPGAALPYNIRSYTMRLCRNALPCCLPYDQIAQGGRCKTKFLPTRGFLVSGLVERMPCAQRHQQHCLKAKSDLKVTSNGVAIIPSPSLPCPRQNFPPLPPTGRFQCRPTMRPERLPPPTVTDYHRLSPTMVSDCDRQSPPTVATDCHRLSPIVTE